MEFNFPYKPASDTAAIGMWDKSTASKVAAGLAKINVTPMEVTQDQLIQLFMLLYPFIASEFVHRSDLARWEDTIRKEFQQKVDTLNQQLDSLTQTLNTHQHTYITPQHPGAPGQTTGAGSASAPKLETWKSKPEDKDFKAGENAIVETSTYTVGIPHRNPEVTHQNYNPKINIKQEFDSAKKYVPFDTESGQVDTGDSDYVGNQGKG